MDLGRQWNERIKIWNDFLPKLYFKECVSISGCTAHSELCSEYKSLSESEKLNVSYFTTMEHLTYEQAMVEFSAKGKIRPAPEGMSWGKKWEYGWFKFSLKVPNEMAGKRIVIYPEAGPEALVYVNGEEAGAFDKFHKYITVAKKAKGGEEFDVVLECYAGHGIRPENGGPYMAGEIPVPEPPEKQVKVGHICWGIWNEEIFQIAMDEFTLYSLLSVLDEKSLRAQKVAKALKNFTLTADFELPEDELLQSLRAADKYLKPALACVNGSTAPVMNIFGQSHLDLAWLWPLAETRRKAARTFSTQLALMDEYPEYRFLACEPFLLEILKTKYPSLFKRFKAKVKNGQIFCDGGMWVESDVNLPWGEAIIRQIVLGRKWFKENLGVDSKTVWLPDTFGFSGSLPQIFAKCGIKYFSTQKLLRCDPENEQFPYNNFWWKGIDGTRILSNMHMKNNAVLTPAALAERWNKHRNQKENISSMIFPFGYGDGGGGPTRQMLEVLKRTKDLEGLPRTKIASLQDFFENLTDPESDLYEEIPNEYSGELYLSWHRGTYTSQARTKKLSRKAEVALHDAEFWTTLAATTADISANRNFKKELDELWHTLLFCQFHDILPGTSIRRVYEEAEKALSDVIEKADGITQKALAMLTELKIKKENSKQDAEKTLYAFNTLGWARKELVKLPGTDLLTEITVPPFGWAKINSENTLDAEQKTSEKSVSAVIVKESKKGGKINSLTVQNKFLKICINASGELNSVYDLENGQELAAAECNRFKMYKDVTPFYDAWELSPMYTENPVELCKDAEISVIAQKSEYVRILIKKNLHNSSLEQIITIRGESRRIDFETKINWNEKHKFLKVEFPLAINSEEAITETQFGYVKRPTHASRQYDKDRYEVCNHRYTAIADESHGAAVLNDSKYGVSVKNNVIALSLLKAAVIPDMFADQGIQEFTYSLYVFNTPFAQGRTIQEAYNLNYPVKILQAVAADAAPIAQVPAALSGSKNGSSLGAVKQYSYFTLTNPNVILETVKLPFEVLPKVGSSSKTGKTSKIVLRLYEAIGAAQNCVLSVNMPVKSCVFGDMEENELAEVPQVAVDKKVPRKNYCTTICAAATLSETKGTAESLAAAPFNLEKKSMEITLDFKPFEIKTLVLEL